MTLPSNEQHIPSDNAAILNDVPSSIPLDPISTSYFDPYSTGDAGSLDTEDPFKDGPDSASRVIDRLMGSQRRTSGVPQARVLLLPSAQKQSAPKKRQNSAKKA